MEVEEVEEVGRGARVDIGGFLVGCEEVGDGGC